MHGYRIYLAGVSWADTQDCLRPCLDLRVPCVLNQVGIDPYFQRLQLSFYLHHLFLCLGLYHDLRRALEVPAIEPSFSFLVESRLVLDLVVCSDHSMTNLRANLSLAHFELAIDYKEHLGPFKLARELVSRLLRQVC